MSSGETPDDRTLAAGLDSTGDLHPGAADLLAGRYQILGVLGEGGMGTVYKVRDLQLDEVVALKTLRRDSLGSPGALARFRREVKLARRVTHKGVARTFDIGEHEGEPFLTMELIDGPSLTGLIDQSGGQLAIAEVLRIGLAVGEALAAAHSSGVIHRDLKPDNVLLASDGRVVVTDFGIAHVDSRERDPKIAATAAGAVVGTPAYMAPEQVEASGTDARSDLYALGLLVFEMSTGRRPFTGNSPFAVAAARLLEPAPDPRTLRSGIPVALAELTMRLLQRDPQLRPQSAAAVLHDLEALRASVDGSGVSSASLGDAATTPRPSLPAPLPRDQTSLAIAPLRTVGPDDERWIGEGLADDLVDGLSLVRGLRVKARSPREADEIAQAYGHRLGVELVVEGSVRKRGDRIRIVLRLTSVADGFQVWAERFDCAFEDLLGESDRIAASVAEAAGRAGAPSSGARAAINPEALELYLRSRELHGRRAIDWTASFELMQRAYDLAPDDPTIVSAYAYSLAIAGFAGGENAREYLDTARRVADRALALAPHRPEPWVAIARVRYNDGDSAGAARALRRALAAGPSVARAHDLAGRILSELDRLDEASAHLERALSVDPSMSYAAMDLARIHALRGDWDACEERLEWLSRSARQFVMLIGGRLSLWADRRLVVGGVTGENVEADHAFRYTTQMLETREMSDEGLRYLDSLIARVPPVSRQASNFHQILTEVHMFTGNHELALRSIGGAIDAGLEDITWLRRCPLLQPLLAAGTLDSAIATVAARADVIARAWDELADATPTSTSLA